MAENIKYWSNVSKRIFYVVLTIVGIYLGYRCAIFYMPFLIAFFISTIMEPAIRFLMKKFKFTRKLSSIIIFIITFGIIIGRINMGNYNISFRISQSITRAKQLYGKGLHKDTRVCKQFRYNKNKVI